MARVHLPAACLGTLLTLSSVALSFQSSSSSPASIVPRATRQAPASQQVILRSDSSLVIIPAHVTTAIGVPVLNLEDRNFHVFEDNVEKTIAHFDRDDAPLSIGILFDQSGSMVNRMDKASEAVAAFLKTTNSEDEFFLIGFSDRAKLLQPFVSDPGIIYEGVRRIRPFGRTALFDAIHLALAQMKKARNARKALLIVSDGGDNWSRHTLSEVRNTLIESDIQLYAMGIFERYYYLNRDAEVRQGPALLTDLADETGGREYTVDNLSELPAISARIGNELRSEYLLGYYSTASRDGKYHAVKVDLTVPNDLPALRTDYRRGYYAATR